MSTMDEAVNLARHGQCVAWIGINRTHARAILNADHDGATRVNRANGRESIEFASGGKVIIHTVDSGARDLRGITLDFAYLPHWKYIRDEGLMSTLLPCFATTGDPRIGVVA